MTTAATDPRVRAVMPTAGALIAAVAAQDAERIDRLIDGCTDIPALLVVLAAQAALPATMPKDTDPALTPDERREAHARYWRGERDALTVFGEREYQRERKRRQRAEQALVAGEARVVRGGIKVWAPVDNTPRHAGNPVDYETSGSGDSRVGSDGATEQAAPSEPALSFSNNERS